MNRQDAAARRAALHASLAAALLAGAGVAAAAPGPAPDAATASSAPASAASRAAPRRASTSSAVHAVAEPTTTAAPSPRARSAAGRTPTGGADAAPVDLFVTRTWAPPPPPPPKPAPPPPPPPPAPPPPPPTAPPLPFTFVGFIETDGGGTKVLLALGGDLIVTRRGEEFAGRRYRLANVTATALDFVYLPLQQHQLLPLPPGSR